MLVCCLVGFATLAGCTTDGDLGDGNADPGQTEPLAAPAQAAPEYERIVRDRLSLPEAALVNVYLPDTEVRVSAYESTGGFDRRLLFGALGAIGSEEAAAGKMITLEVVYPLPDGTAGSLTLIWNPTSWVRDSGVGLLESDEICVLQGYRQRPSPDEITWMKETALLSGMSPDVVHDIAASRIPVPDMGTPPDRPTATP